MARDDNLHVTLVPDHEGIRVLLVDPNISSMQYTASLLEAQAFKVARISEQAVALAMLRDEDRFDLIVVSLEAQDVNFIAFLNHLRMIDANIPIVVILPDQKEDQTIKIRSALSTGASFFLRRPILPDGEVKNLWQHVVRIRNKTALGKAKANSTSTVAAYEEEERPIQEISGSELMIIEDAGTQEHDLIPNNINACRDESRSVDYYSKGDQNKQTMQIDDNDKDSETRRMPGSTTIKECTGNKRKVAVAVADHGNLEQGESKRRKIFDSHGKKKKKKKKNPGVWNSDLCEKFRAALRRSANYKDINAEEAGRTKQVQAAASKEPNRTQCQVTNHPDQQGSQKQGDQPPNENVIKTRRWKRHKQHQRTGGVGTKCFEPPPTSMASPMIQHNGMAKYGSQTEREGREVTRTGLLDMKIGARVIDASVGATAHAKATNASAGSRTTAVSAGASVTAVGARRSLLEWIIKTRETYRGNILSNSAVSTREHLGLWKQEVNHRELMTNILHAGAKVPNAGFVPSISEQSLGALVGDMVGSNQVPLNFAEERILSTGELNDPSQFPESLVWPSTNSYLGKVNNKQGTLLEWNSCGRWDELSSQNEDLGFASSNVLTIMNQHIAPTYLNETASMSSTHQNNDLLDYVPEPSSLDQRHTSSCTRIETTSYATSMPIPTTGFLWNAQASYAGSSTGNLLEREEIPTASLLPIPQGYPYEGAPPSPGGSLLVREEIPRQQHSWAEIPRGSYQMPTTDFPQTPRYLYIGLMDNEDIPASTLFHTTSYCTYSGDPSSSLMATEEIPTDLPTDDPNIFHNKPGQ